MEKSEGRAFPSEFSDWLDWGEACELEASVDTLLILIDRTEAWLDRARELGLCRVCATPTDCDRPLCEMHAHPEISGLRQDRPS